MIGIFSSSNCLSAPKSKAKNNLDNDKNRIQLKIKMLQGHIFDLQSDRNNITIVNMWAYWCGICKSELEMLNNLNRKYRFKKVKIIGISIDDPEEINMVRRVTSKLSFKNGMYVDSIISDIKRPVAIPETYIFDSNNQLINVFNGKSNDGEIEKIILNNIE